MCATSARPAAVAICYMNPLGLPVELTALPLYEHDDNLQESESARQRASATAR